MTSRRVLFFAVLVLLGAAVAAASLRADPRGATFPLAATADREVTPAELAGWIVEGRRDFTVVDLRPTSAFEAAHVRGAVSCASCHRDRAAGRAAQAGDGFVDLSRKVVLYAQTGQEPVAVPRILRANPRVLVLRGGFDGWSRDVLAPVDLAAAQTDEEVAAALRRAALRAYFTGEAAAEQPAARAPVEPVRRGGAHAAGGSSEGC
jgi:rhodanese-related sulfurtransferase